jgi:hypothetical protein
VTKLVVLSISPEGTPGWQDDRLRLPPRAGLTPLLESKGESHHMSIARALRLTGPRHTGPLAINYSISWAT